MTRHFPDPEIIINGARISPRQTIAVLAALKIARKDWSTIGDAFIHQYLDAIDSLFALMDRAEVEL